MTERVLTVFSVAGLPCVSHLYFVPDYEEMCAAQTRCFEARRGVDDDRVPLAQTHFGMGIFGAIFGSEIVWQPEHATSWSRTPLSEWPDDLGSLLRFDPDNAYVDLVRRSIRYHRTVSQGRFGIGCLETIDALNLVNELRGATEGFTDLYLQPDVLREVMGLGVQWNIDWLEMQMAEAGTFAGGWCSIMDWFPARTVWLSVDAYGSCKSETYVQLGREYMQRLIDHFGYGWQHLHSDGVRLLPEIVKLRNLLGIQIGADEGYPRPFDIVRELQTVTGEIPLQIGCTWAELCEGIECGTLAGGVEYRVSGAPSIGEANMMAARAREYQDDHRDVGAVPDSAESEGGWSNGQSRH
ncbi:MAG: hypothetical protein MUQ10_07705, partial [Anaerolineae bacterium]|nr:hypothetical protein [Anaerolineae bacterium]